MRDRLNRWYVVLPIIVQLAGGVVTALVTLGIYAWLLTKGVSRPSAERSVDSYTVLVFLLLVVPAVLVSVGSYVQTIRRKPWAVAFVLIGGGCNAVVVSLFVGFLFGYTGNIWGQRAVLANGIAVGLTLVTALVNLALWATLPNQRLPVMSREAQSSADGTDAR